MTILILVMSAQKEPYGSLMDCQKQTWDKEHMEGAGVVYYCGRQDSTTRERVFYSRYHDEELDNLSARTIEAFEESLKYPWDFMARPHSSTYVHKVNLVKHCETLPKENLLSGLLAFAGTKDEFLWGGGHFIFSRDVIEKFVENKKAWRLDIMEDNAISRMGQLLNIPVHPGKTSTINKNPDGSWQFLLYNGGESFDFTDWVYARRAEGHFFVRCKQDFKRHEDIEIMKKLHQYL